MAQECRSASSANFRPITFVSTIHAYSPPKDSPELAQGTQATAHSSARPPPACAGVCTAWRWNSPQRRCGCPRPCRTRSRSSASTPARDSPYARRSASSPTPSSRANRTSTAGGNDRSESGNPPYRATSSAGTHAKATSSVNRGTCGVDGGDGGLETRTQSPDEATPTNGPLPLTDHSSRSRNPAHTMCS